MSDRPHISERAEYDAMRSNGVEQCPVCGRTLGGECGYYGEVVQPTGPATADVFDHLYKTDPGDGVVYCIDCWTEHRREVREQSHRTLDEFAPAIGGVE